MTLVKHVTATVTNCSNLKTISVSQSHESAVAVATVTCVDTDLDVGDSVTIELGYTDGYTGRVFKGYVKQKNYAIPDGLWSLVCHDAMTRAVDYFIVSSNPNAPLTYDNISAETLVKNLMALAGLNSFTADTTYFTFGVQNPVEINLVSSYDFSRMIGDLVAFNLWCDTDGKIHFENRKPYPMDGTSDQPGDKIDRPADLITDATILRLDIGFNEKDLRNRIVVYGAPNISSDDSSPTSYDPYLSNYRQILPINFYKAAVLASPLIESQDMADKTASYNLHWLNRLTYEMPMTIEGNAKIEARNCVEIDSDYSNIRGLWYIYQLEHSWSDSGYITNLVLRM